MKKEEKLAFRSRIDVVHPCGIRNMEKKARPDEVEITDEWHIRADVLNAESPAADLQDFLLTSMGISVPFGAKSPVLELHAGTPSSFTLDVTSEKIILSGNIRKGVHYLEELMADREAPFVKKGKTSIRLRFSPRMVHSGWGLDEFPDSHLNAISHAGYDAILVFTRGPGRAAFGPCDFNDLIRRAANFDLKVYFYSYLNSFKHPDDPDAEKFFDDNFGIMFKLYPKAAGLILVGESCIFPTKDPARFAGDFEQPSGFFPANDYPKWLNAVKNAVRRYSPHADVVFWTYNFGRSPEKQRLALIEQLPKDVSVEVTFEMYQLLRRKHCTAQVPDYTITFPGPCDCFKSEAAAIAKAGLPLYAMVNTSGSTWDCGVIPYAPALYQWAKRFEEIIKANEKWNLAGLMENHHNGWFPGPVQECAKRYFRCPEAGIDKALELTARKFYGEKASAPVLKGWKKWSEAMASYIPGFDDQNGPLRVGPAYPFLFEPVQYPYFEDGTNSPFPTDERRRLLRFPYTPEQLTGPSYAGIRLKEDLQDMKKALKLWHAGDAIMRRTLPLVPEGLRDEAERQFNIGFFFGCTLVTMYHTKQYYLLNQKLKIEGNPAKANKILDQMDRLLREEAANAEEAVAFVENDSRLGWEPRMEYVGHADHIRWKIEQVKRVLDTIIPAYRKSVNL